MAGVTLYIATSLDGYIADSDGGVGWLEPYADALAGFGEFLASLTGAIMGRATYDFVRTLGAWPYPGLPTRVLTRNQIQAPSDTPEGLVRAHPGPVSELIESFGADHCARIWLIGGGRTVRAFLDAGLVDELRVFVLPVLLHRGARLFPEGDNAPGTLSPTTLTHTGSTAFPSGAVELRYHQSPTAA